MLLQYHLAGVSYRNWDVTVYTSSLLSALFRKPDILEFKLPECKASALTPFEGPESCLCHQEGLATHSFPPLADPTQLWKWMDSGQQNLQPAVRKCPKRH